MNSALIATVAMGGLGLLLSSGLAWAQRLFRVEEDTRLENLGQLLPGLNCGACGYAGCRQLAEALLSGGALANSCLPGGTETATKIGQFLGTGLKIQERQIARLHCQGGRPIAKEKGNYQGIITCQAAQLIGGGERICLYGCIGYGDCLRICPVKAITIGPELLPRIDYEVCVGCGLCVAVCPRGVISLHSTKARVLVLCTTEDRGAAAKQVCLRACIACQLCGRVCPRQAITMEGNLPRIDQTKCDLCGICVEKCPTKAMVMLPAAAEP